MITVRAVAIRERRRSMRLRVGVRRTDKLMGVFYIEQSGNMQWSTAWSMLIIQWYIMYAT